MTLEDEPDDKREEFTSVFGIKLRVGISPISRYGVFANQDIESGTRIIEYLGELVNNEEGNLRDEKYVKELGMIYVFELSETESVDGLTDGNQSIYINHSCDPNCRYKIVNKHIYIESIKSIKAGEELFYDYECSPDPDPIPCKCGTSLCRGTINLLA